MIPGTMCAVLLTGHGGFDNLDYRNDVPMPRLGAGQVLIRVADIVAAQRDFLAKKYVGKLVLTIT